MTTEIINRPIHRTPLAWHKLLPVDVANAGHPLEYDPLADDARNYLYHKKWWHQDLIYCNPIPDENRLPPFQVWRERSYFPIKYFQLRYLPTDQNTLLEYPQGAVDILTQNDDLQILPEGQYNYPLVGCVAQADDPDDFTSYGFSIGAFQNFKFLEFWISAYNAVTQPTGLRCYLYDSKGGTLLDEVLVKFLSEPLIPDEFRKVTVELNSVIQNTAGDVLWVEISADDKFAMVGRDGATYDFTPEVNTTGNGYDVLSHPSTDQPGENYDGFVNAYLGGTPGDVIIYYGVDSLVGETIEIGQWYCIMWDGDLTENFEVFDNCWVSEPFNVVPNIWEFLKLEWWHYRPFKTEEGFLLYENDYRNVLYLASYVVQPDYNKEVTIKNRNGEKFKTSVVSWKSWKVTLLLPEYIIDAVKLAEEHDRVALTDHEGKVFDITYFEIDDNIEWQQGSRVAQVTFEFETGSRVNPARAVTSVEEGYAAPGDGGDIYGISTPITVERVAQTFMYVHPNDGSSVATVSLPFTPPEASEDYLSYLERFEVYRGSDRVIFMEDGSDGHTWDSTLKEFYLPSGEPLQDYETLFFRLLPI